MTSSIPRERGPHRDAAVALQEIRLAEATRMLGLLEADTLDALDATAAAWLLDGVDSPGLRALATAPTADRPARLEAAARELGLSFPTVQDARKFHINVAMAEGPLQMAAQSFTMSNNFTDHVSSTLRRMVDAATRRLRRRG